MKTLFAKMLIPAPVCGVLISRCDIPTFSLSLLTLRAAIFRKRFWHKEPAQNTEKADICSKYPESLKPLSDLPVGCHAIVRYLHGGRWFFTRLAGLGVTPGVELTVLQNFGRGPMIVTVRDTRIALGRSETFRVLVETI